jgi:transcription initiation factor IIE alpha subunit
MQTLFKCRKCGKPLNLFDSTEFAERLRKKIAELEANLK